MSHHRSLFACAALLSATIHAAPETALDFSLRSIDGQEVKLDRYRGKVLLVVNVASRCGFTKQYKGLVALHRQYKDRGLAVIGVPANDFGKQEPGANAEIKAFCRTTFDVDFDMMAKITVKGDGIHPFYRYLTSHPRHGGSVRWNFEKFLIDAGGELVDRFRSNIKPESAELIAAIEAALKDKAAVPAAQKTYMGRRVAPTLHWKAGHWLLRNKREREEATSVMIKELGVTPGHIVCDIGCGNGYHTLRLAKLVGASGKIVSVDIQSEMLMTLRKRVAEAGITNVEPVLGLPYDPKLKPDTFDLILLADTYHEFSHPVHMLAAIRKALKPTGRLVLLEFKKEDNTIPIKPDHKMTKAQIMVEFQANGLELVKAFDGLPWQHMMFFRRTVPSTPAPGHD